jgi:hypothetical protein
VPGIAVDGEPLAAAHAVGGGDLHERRRVDRARRHDSELPGEPEAQARRVRRRRASGIGDEALRADALALAQNKPPIECLAAAARKIALQPLDGIARHPGGIGPAKGRQTVDRGRVSGREVARVDAEVTEKGADIAAGVEGRKPRGP